MKFEMNHLTWTILYKHFNLISFFGNNILTVFFFFFLKTVPSTRLASLPPAFIGDKPYASEYGVALALLPPDEEDKNEASRELSQDTLNRNLLLNVEYRINGFPHVTLTDAGTNLDVVKGLVSDGLLLVEKRREKRLAKLVRKKKCFIYLHIKSKLESLV